MADEFGKPNKIEHRFSTHGAIIFGDPLKSKGIFDIRQGRLPGEKHGFLKDDSNLSWQRPTNFHSTNMDGALRADQ